MHGAGGGAPNGTAHPKFKHGLRTKEMREVRLLARLMARFGDG
jgi:hypothetical protein